MGSARSAVLGYLRCGFSMFEVAVVIALVLAVLSGAYQVATQMHASSREHAFTDHLTRVAGQARRLGLSMVYSERASSAPLGFTDALVASAHYPDTVLGQVGTTPPLDHLLSPAPGYPVFAGPGQSGSLTPFELLGSDNAASFLIRIGAEERPVSDADCAMLLQLAYQGMAGIMTTRSRSTNALAQPFTADTGPVVAPLSGTPVALRVVYHDPPSGLVQSLADRNLTADAACDGSDDHVIYISFSFGEG